MFCCITPERERKTTRMMRAIAQGWGDGATVVHGEPPNDVDPFAVWGHLWLAERIIPPAMVSGRPWWLVDNGWFLPAKGEDIGYYRMTFRGVAPVFLPRPDMKRNATNMLPWRTKAARGHILLALPGEGFAKPFGFNLNEWALATLRALRARTDRQVLIREKGCPRPLHADLNGAWAVVTHSSAVGVDAVLHGIPAFVHEWSAAAPVGNLDLSDIESPLMPEGRDVWWQSLMCQQFTLREMASGLAFSYLSEVRHQWEQEHNGLHV